MFESLADQIRHDELAETTRRARVVRNIVIAAVSVLVFGGLYIALRAAG